MRWCLVAGERAVREAHAPSLAASAAIRLIRCYQLMVSPWLQPACRYLPSCSEYFIEALAAHGLLRGGWLGVQRLARCHPFGGHGLDPVPRGD